MQHQYAIPKYFFFLSLFLALTLPCKAQSPAERSAQLTQQALDLMLYTRSTEGPSVWKQGVDLLNEAVTLDSTNARAYASMVLPYIMMPNQGEMELPAARKKAEAAIQKSMDLNPDLSDAFLAKGMALMVYENDMEEAEKTLEKALSLDPDHAEAHREYGLLFLRTGRHQQALAEINKSIKLDERSLQNYPNQCNALRQLGRLEEAEAAGRKALERHPANGAACLAQLYWATGKFEEMRSLAEQQLASKPNDASMKFNKGMALAGLGDHEASLSIYNALDNPGALGVVYALAGDEENATAQFARVKDLIDQGQWGWHMAIAEAQLAMGNQEKAITSYTNYFEAAAEFPIAREELQWWLTHASGERFDTLRKAPQIQAILTTPVWDND